MEAMSSEQALRVFCVCPSNRSAFSYIETSVIYAADEISKDIITIFKIRIKLSASRALIFKAVTARSAAGSKLLGRVVHPTR
jgi:hypothetical protein